MDFAPCSGQYLAKKTLILHIRSLSGARLALVGLTDQLVHGKIPGALLGGQRVCGQD